MLLCRLAVRQVTAVSRGMMLEISALRAQVAHLEQEKNTQEEQLGLKFKERYDPLVRHLFSTCIQLKVRKLKVSYPNNRYRCDKIWLISNTKLHLKRISYYYCILYCIKLLFAALIGLFFQVSHDFTWYWPCEPLPTFIWTLCVSQARLDDYHRQMEQDVSEMVNRTRGEGVDRIIKLKKKYGCTKDNDELTLTQSKVQQRRKGKSIASGV